MHALEHLLKYVIHAQHVSTASQTTAPFLFCNKFDKYVCAENYRIELDLTNLLQKRKGTVVCAEHVCVFTVESSKRTCCTHQ